VKKLLTLLSASALILTGIVAAEDKPTFRISGDFRYRHEMIEKEGFKTQTRQRIRARANIEGKVNDEARVVIGISSGSADPVSNNQTLGDAFSSKDVVLDLAYIEYNWKKTPGLTLQGGKVYNPFFLADESELVWDSDLRFEGMVAQYKRAFDLTSVELTGTGFWVQERKTDKNSSLMAAEGVLSHEVPDFKMTASLGGSYYYYDNSKGYAPYFDHFAGNSPATSIVISEDETDTIEVYANEFKLFEVFGKIDVKAGEIPVSLIGNYVQNTAADSLNDGWLVSIKIGKTKKPGSWDLRYVYRELKKDAVIGAFTDSDFIGGGTDGKGHEINAGIQVTQNTSLAATYFINKLGLEKSKDFNRLQVDAKFKF